jgi:integrase
MGDAAMRRNGNGIRHFVVRTFDTGKTVYYWLPPAYARQRGFHHTTLGTDRKRALELCAKYNSEIERYLPENMRVRVLATAKPGSAAWLARSFEASAKYSRYSSRTRQDYTGLYRRLEMFVCDGGELFGNTKVTAVTKQLVHSIYEPLTAKSGLAAANKMMTAWQAAFKFGTLILPEVQTNPFSRLGRESPPARRQRWTDEQLLSFIRMANELGCRSVGLCALMCMELMQRPGDILSLTWNAYIEADGYVLIKQSKRGVEVRVPPTERLRRELDKARSAARVVSGDLGKKYICPTKTGKRWNRHNFSKAVRMIAKAAGVTPELQIRDLRRTAATEGASAGATPWEMMAAGGWQNQASIQPYLIWTPEQAAAFQAKREAYRKLLATRKIEQATERN